MHQKTCNNCNVIYTTAHENSKYCSNLCCTKSNNEKQKYLASNKAVPFKRCLLCKTSFPSKRMGAKYCSHKCAAIVSNTQRVRQRKKPKFSCLACTKLTSSKSKVCSKECKKTLKVEKWLSGIEPGHTKYGTIKSTIREYLFAQVNYTCACGFSGVNPITNKSILQIDHIDGDCLNSTPSNLRVLCPNCHAMTSTYGRLNITSSRVWKRSNYQKSKIS